MSENPLYTPPFYPTRGYTDPFKIGDVAGGNYSYFQPDGFQFAEGEARGYYDYNVGGIELGAGASAPDLVTIGAGTILYRAFDGGNIMEQLFGCFEMNHDWAEGTPAFPHCHIYFTSANAGNLKLNLTYTFDTPDQPDPAEAVISTVVAAPGATWNRVVSFPQIALPAVRIGSQFSFRFWRNPSDAQDTYASDVILKTFGLHVLLNSPLGSREITEK